MACYQFLVPQAAEGQRLDVCVRRFLPEITAPMLRSAFQHRDVKLDGKRMKPDTRVAVGQLVQVYCPEPPAEAISVVYEDTDTLIINKRAGVSVEPDDGPGVSLCELAARYAQRQQPGATAPIPCHRLDNQTCGLIVFARTQRAAEILQRAFRERRLDKQYIALVKGQPKPPSATCHAWLLKDAQAARVTILDREVKGARPIATAYETLDAGPISRLRIHLLTGRTHQIRAHMAALGHPLLGDDVYGDRAFNRAMRAQGKLMLCAASLTLETDGALPQLDGKTFTVPCPF